MRHKYVLITSFLISGCAVVSHIEHPSFSSTRLAEVQDSVAHGLAPVSRLHEWDAYCEASRRWERNNLEIRQAFLYGDTATAWAGMRMLSRTGYWAENYSYLLYTESAWWYYKKGGGK